MVLFSFLYWWLEQSAGQPVLAAASDLVVPPLCAPGSLGEMLRKMEYSIPNSDHDGSWTFQYHFHSVSHQNGQRLRVSPHWPGMTRTWSSKRPKVARRLVHSSMDTVPDFFVSYDTYNAWGQLGPRPLGWKWDELTHVAAHRFTQYLTDIWI